MFDYSNFIDERGIDNLKKYKYSHTGYTKLDQFLNDFWLAFTELLPRNLAPNMITLLGCICLVVPTLMFVVYDPSFESRFPSYFYFIAAIGVFFYQTLDAADGKQARRIGAASPLGQLLDHGCDSFGGVYLMILLVATGGMNTTFMAYSCIFLYILSFYIANWSEYYTHISITRIGQLGVTEIQWMSILFLVYSGINGYGIGEIRIGSLLPFLAKDSFAGALTIGEIIIASLCTSAPFNTLYSFKVTYDHMPSVKEALIKLLPLVVILMGFLTFIFIDEYLPYKGYLMIGMGLYNSLLICKMIVSGLTSKDFDCVQYELFIPLILGNIAKYSNNHSIRMQVLVLLIVSGFYLFCQFTYNVIKKIADVCNIKVLTV